MDVDDLIFRHPCNIMIVGPTGSGKTVITTKLIRQAQYMFKPIPQRFIWCYSEYQDIYKSMPQVEFIEGLPSMDMLRKDTHIPKMVILDDLMTSMNKTNLSELFTKGSHHTNTTIVNLVQNLFYEGIRTSRINSHYLLLLRNPNEKSQIHKLSNQLYPEKRRFLIDVYNDATRLPYTYLLIDLHQKTPDSLRLRTNIFQNNICHIYQSIK